MACGKHPRYKGKREPKNNCLQCWVDYLENTDGAVSKRELAQVICSLLAAVHQEVYTRTVAVTDDNFL